MPGDPTQTTAFLDGLNTSNQARATAYDVVHNVADDAAAKALLDSLPFSNDVRATIWDLRRGGYVEPGGPPTPADPRAFTERLPVPGFDLRPPAKGAGLLADIGSAVKVGLASNPLVQGLIGAKAKAATTAFNMNDLGRRAIGAPRIIDEPDVQAAMRMPDTLPAHMGGVLETGAEFAVPESRVLKAAEAAQLGRAGSLALKTVAGGATAATVAGLQTGGDPTAMKGAAVVGGAVPVVGKALGAGGRVVQRMAAGAEEGGLGGAVSGLIRQVADTTPVQKLTQALKPRNTNARWATDLGRSIPEVTQSADELGKPVTSLDTLLEALKHAKQRVWNQYQQIAGPQALRGIDLSPVADAIDGSIPKKTILQSAGEANRIREIANTYRGRTFTIDEAEELLRETNAELDAYYNKLPMGQRVARDANPETAHLVAEAKALRDTLYNMLDAAGEGAGARELKQRYGALMNLEETATSRVNIAARQQPVSLGEQIGQVRAIGHMARGAYRITRGDVVGGTADMVGGTAERALAKHLKEQQTTDALIKRAFAASKVRPVPVSVESVRPAGLLSPPIGKLPPPEPPQGGGGGGVRARPLTIEMDPSAPNGFRVTQWSTDPNAGPGMPDVTVPPPRPAAGPLLTGPPGSSPSTRQPLLPPPRGNRPPVEATGPILVGPVPTPPGRLVPAAPVEYQTDLLGGNARTVKQFSGDPAATPAPIDILPAEAQTPGRGPGAAVDLPGTGVAGSPVPDAAQGTGLGAGGGRSPEAARAFQAAPEADRALADTHYATARANGFDGTVEDFYQVLEPKLREARGLMDEVASMAQEHDPKNLLRQIAKYGGLKRVDPSSPGEIRWLMESMDKEGRARPRMKSGPMAGVSREGSVNVDTGSLGGIKGVVEPVGRGGGKSLEHMAELISQTPGFEHLPYDRFELFKAIQDAMAPRTFKPTMSLDTALDAVGVRPGERWWESLDAGDFDPETF